MSAIQRLRSLLRRIFTSEGGSTAKWFLLSSIVGIVAGLGAILFQASSQFVLRYSLSALAHYSPGEPRGEHSFFSKPPEGDLSPLWLLTVITMGGLCSGLIVYTFAPEAEGHGTDAAIEAFHQKRGVIRPLIPLVKMVASAITIGTGGSGGREGPIAQIGAGFGSFLGTALKLSARDRRILLTAGIAAGVGSIFRAPLAGALFSAEILYRDADLETDSIIPSAIASIIGFSVYSLSLPADKRFMPLFGNHLSYSLASAAELIPLTILVLVLVGASIAYIKVFYGLHDAFKKVPVIRQLRPAIGALAAGLCGLTAFYVSGRPEILAVLSTGYGALQVALEDSASLGATALLAIAVLKIVTTSLTIGSGGSGGVFGPSMVIGGCLGGACGLAAHSIAPNLAPKPEIFAIVGMAGFFAGCAHAPISTIVMVSEMTGDYRLLLPTMWVSTLCFLLCRPWSLYVKQVPSRMDSPAHRGDFLVDVLEGLHVADLPLQQRQTITESMSIRDVIQLIPASRQHHFPVVDAVGSVVGMLSLDDIRPYFFDQSIWSVANARDAMTTSVIGVTPRDDLNTALRRFTTINVEELPVFGADDSRQLLGMIRRGNAIEAYNRRILEHQQAVEAHR
jgi:CIC family chloride channel protein